MLKTEIYVVASHAGLRDSLSEATLAGKSYCTDPGEKNKSRQVAFVADLVADGEEVDNPDSLEMLVGVQWQVFKVSPLWGVAFKDVSEEEPTIYDLESLKRHAAVIGSVVGEQTEVEVAPLPGLRGSRFDKEALVITVRKKMGAKSICIFMGVLCATEAKELQLCTRKAFQARLGMGTKAQERLSKRKLVKKVLKHVL